jgi:hypothetical protein
MSLSCSVRRVTNVAVQLDEAPWSFAIQNREQIYEFWRTKQESNPYFYNGQVHIMTSWSIRGTGFGTASFVGYMRRTDFASFLYWKEFGGGVGEIDFSGGAALLCSDGAVLLAVSGEHTIAPGILEFPGGFVDVADFENNKLQFDLHVAREVAEEFAISKSDLGKPQQYLVAGADRIVQVISIFKMDVSGTEFIRSWRARTGASRLEVSNIIAIYGLSDLMAFSIQAHVRAVLSHLLDQ